MIQKDTEPDSDAFTTASTHPKWREQHLSSISSSAVKKKKKKGTIASEELNSFSTYIGRGKNHFEKYTRSLSRHFILTNK